MFGGFPRGCLSLCFLQASSAAAEQRIRDEGTRKGERYGAAFFWLLFCCCRQKSNSAESRNHGFKDRKATQKTGARLGSSAHKLRV